MALCCLGTSRIACMKLKFGRITTNGVFPCFIFWIPHDEFANYQSLLLFMTFSILLKKWSFAYWNWRNRTPHDTIYTPFIDGKWIFLSLVETMDVRNRKRLDFWDLQQISSQFSMLSWDFTVTWENPPEPGRGIEDRQAMVSSLSPSIWQVGPFFEVATSFVVDFSELHSDHSPTSLPLAVGSRSSAKHREQSIFAQGQQQEDSRWAHENQRKYSPNLFHEIPSHHYESAEIAPFVNLSRTEDNQPTEQR